MVTLISLNESHCDLSYFLLIAGNAGSNCVRVASFHFTLGTVHNTEHVSKITK